MRWRRAGTGAARARRAWRRAPRPAREAGAEAGCGPTNTTSNCGKCGNVCTPTGATADLCNGLSCTYTCTAGHSDCNSATPTGSRRVRVCDARLLRSELPDGALERRRPELLRLQRRRDVHGGHRHGGLRRVRDIHRGLGGRLLGGWTCTGNPTQYVCYGTGHNNDTCANYCWLYTGTAPDGGPGAGQVIDCSCPGNYIGPWD